MKKEIAMFVVSFESILFIDPTDHDSGQRDYTSTPLRIVYSQWVAG